ncbi:GPP34 family phosphoprotein [uncultured Enterococcus sp.]|uniref:GPP34 family phosphoprotein n=1 Tax=uncultured Enterococcus sp. TaxID=167972 RepID=UPI002AA7128E|nr:GPP34 family phosphoprotein [uncultured Enterococcus sp.]
MKNLTISEQFFLLMMNKKGTIGALNDYGKISLVMAGLLDLQNAGILKIEESQVVLLETEIPENYQSLAPLAAKIYEMKKRTLEKIADAYGGTFLDRELNLLIQNIRQRLEEKGVIQKKQESGLLGEKVSWFADEAKVGEIIDSLKGAFDNVDGHLDQLALVLLLQKSNALAQYLSKHDQKVMKEDLKELKHSPLAKDVQKMMNVIDQMYVILAVVAIV